MLVIFGHYIILCKNLSFGYAWGGVRFPESILIDKCIDILSSSRQRFLKQNAKIT